jgi:hypothetical protein
MESLTSVSRQQPPFSEQSPIRTWEIYAAAGFGGLCFALSELIKETEGSMPVRIGEYFKTKILAQATPEPYVILTVLMMTVVLAWIAVWIHEPRSRPDAFARGLAVFAVLSISAPTAETEKGRSSSRNVELTNNWIPVRPAENSNSSALEAPESRTTSNNADARAEWFVSILSPAVAQEKDQSADRLEATIHLVVEPGPSQLPEPPLVTVRDPKSGQILARRRLSDGNEVNLTAPPGKYEIQVDGSGVLRSRATLVLDANNTYSYSVRRSSIPAGIQYLLPRESVELRSVSPNG